MTTPRTLQIAWPPSHFDDYGDEAVLPIRAGDLRALRDMWAVGVARGVIAALQPAHKAGDAPSPDGLAIVAAIDRLAEATLATEVLSVHRGPSGGIEAAVRRKEMP